MSWRNAKIGDLVTLEYGKGLKNYQSNEYPYAVYGTNGRIGSTEVFLYDKPSLVIGRKGAYRGVHFAELPFYVIDTAFFTKLKDLTLDVKFLFYWFRCVDINSMDSGSAIPSTNRDEVYELDIQLPTPSEQRAIAGVLSSLDDKIDLLHRQNKTLEALAETLFRRWFAGQSDEEWGVTLSDVLETCSGGTPSRSRMDFYEGGDIKWVKSKELNGGFVIDTEERINEQGLKSSAAKLLPENAILIALYGATVGEYAILAEPMTCNQAVCAIKPSDDYPFTFLFMFFKTLKEELINMAVGSAQQNISQVLIRQVRLPNNTRLTREYHNLTVSQFEKLKRNIHHIRTLEKLRDTLLPKLMSGEVRVEPALSLQAMENPI